MELQAKHTECLLLLAEHICLRGLAGLILDFSVHAFQPGSVVQ